MVDGVCGVGVGVGCAAGDGVGLEELVGLWVVVAGGEGDESGVVAGFGVGGGPCVAVLVGGVAVFVDGGLGLGAGVGECGGEVSGVVCCVPGGGVVGDGAAESVGEGVVVVGEGGVGAGFGDGVVDAAFTDAVIGGVDAGGVGGVAAAGGVGDGGLSVAVLLSGGVVGPGVAAGGGGQCAGEVVCTVGECTDRGVIRRQRRMHRRYPPPHIKHLR